MNRQERLNHIYGIAGKVELAAEDGKKKTFSLMLHDGSELTGVWDNSNSELENEVIYFIDKKRAEHGRYGRPNEALIKERMAFRYVTREEGLVV